MARAKELTLWLKKTVEFLIQNKDYVGAWKKLNDVFYLVVLWEEGWGQIERDDVIQFDGEPDWGLCAGIKIYSPKDELDMWRYPWDKDSSELLTESVGISPKEDYEQLSLWILEEFKKLEHLQPSEDGSVSASDLAAGEDFLVDDEKVELVPLDPDEDVQEVKEGLINKKSKQFTQRELKELEQDLYDYLNTEWNIFPDDGLINNSYSPSGNLIIKLEISGDRKNECILKINSAVSNWCDSKGFVIEGQTEEEIGEYYSDWSVAIHTWEIFVASDEADSDTEVENSAIDYSLDNIED